MTTSEYRRSEAWQPITITQAMKQRLVQDNQDRRISLNGQRGSKAASLASAKIGLKQAEDRVKAAEADLKLIDQQLQENLKEQLTISRLRTGDYEVVGSPSRPVITSLFGKPLPQEYVYITASRTGGRSHTTRWDEKASQWRCDCEGGYNRGYCWVVKGIQRGIKHDTSGRPYIIDEKYKSHPMASFKREV
jgi:hypothetical protein